MISEIEAALKKVVFDIKKNGFSSFLKKAHFYYFGKGKLLWALNVADWQTKKALVQNQKIENFSKRSGKKQKIVYVIPSTKIAGGIAVVLQHANRLLERGYDVAIFSQDLNSEVNWFANQKVPIIPMNKLGKILEEGIDILIATGWGTAPTVDLLLAKRKLYFLQLDERRFYSDEKMIEFVAQTYRLDFEYLTMAKWMQVWIKKEFDHEAQYVPNGLDLNIFNPSSPIEKRGEKLRVLLEGPINIPFKGVAEAYEAVKDLDCELWIVSSNGRPPAHWKYERFFEKAPINEMAGIYASCDILLKMSTVESFSYPPLEMMACGGAAVIRQVSGIEEYAVHGENCLIVQDEEEAKAAVRRLLEDKPLREFLQQNGLQTAQNWSWDKSIDALEEVING